MAVVEASTAAQHLSARIPAGATPQPPAAVGSMIGLAVLAIAMLLLGAAVYVLERPAGSAYLLPPSWSLARNGPPRPGAFAAIGAWLPSFVHAFSFSLLTALLLPRRTGPAAAACGSWALINALAEIGQHRAVSPLIVDAIGNAFHGIPVLDHLGRYVSKGTFDPFDLLAGIGGSLTAFVALHWSHRAGQPEMSRPAGPGRVQT